MSWAHSGLFVMATLLGGGGAPYEATHPGVYAGTYEIRLCHGTCAEPAYFAGTLVLFGQPLRDARGRVFRAWLDRYPANGCFVRAEASTAESIGFGTHGFFSWALREGATYLDLVRSPDGGYAVRLKLVPKGLRGTGTWWGGAVGAEAPDLPSTASDVVVAERLGGPDVGRCPPMPRPARVAETVGH